MTRFLLLLACIFLFIFSWPTIKEHVNINDFQKAIDSKISDLKNNKELQETIETGSEKIQQAWNQLTSRINEQQRNTESNQENKIDLKTPSNHLFSINNIELGDKEESITKHLGKAKRSSLNEYGENWNTYHDNYQHFFMVMYDKNHKVSGLYTNQNLIASTKGIKLGISKDKVRKNLGNPLTGIQKGFINYQFQKNSDFDVYLLDGVYVTIFYDKHEKNTVTAMQLIRQDIEQKKKDYYPAVSSALVNGFEYQLFDLTNSSRVMHHLPILTWDQHVRITARDHSLDMAKNQYFEHTNLKGQSPFDRMSQDHITFLMAGENIAYGQLSSIFAHEGLMNSLGHRENILQKGYKYLGVGVAFNEKSQPYYTENFYAK
ncbi:CAP domain-containing protein [Heyndrickxia sporothermodurans]|nr:CAP domain-containing protein [Heyndrickxia sporothermodurans]